MPANKRKKDSKTPIPLGAVGTIRPIDHDKQKITNKNIKFIVLFEFKALKQIKNPINFEITNPTSNKRAFVGKKEFKLILSSN